MFYYYFFFSSPSFSSSSSKQCVQLCLFPEIFSPCNSDILRNFIHSSLMNHFFFSSFFFLSFFLFWFFIHVYSLRCVRFFFSLIPYTLLHFKGFFSSSQTKIAEVCGVPTMYICIIWVNKCVLLYGGPALFLFLILFLHFFFKKYTHIFKYTF